MRLNHLPRGGPVIEAHRHRLGPFAHACIGQTALVSRIEDADRQKNDRHYRQPVSPKPAPAENDGAEQTRRPDAKKGTAAMGQQ